MLKQYRASTIITKPSRSLPTRLLNWSELFSSWIIFLLAGISLLLGMNPWYVWGACLFALVDILGALVRIQAKHKLVVLLVLSFTVWQPATAQIHQAGQTTIELSGGLMDGFKLPGQDNFGTFGSFSYGKYKTLNSYWKGTVHLNQKFYAYDKTMVPVSQWLGEATYFTRVMGLVNKSWVLNVGGGLAGGYESINQDRGEIKGASIMNQSGWVLGPTLAIEGEYILTGRTILIARVQEYYLFRSNIIPTHFNLGVGVKFILDTDSDYK